MFLLNISLTTTMSCTSLLPEWFLCGRSPPDAPWVRPLLEQLDWQHMVPDVPMGDDNGGNAVRIDLQYADDCSGMSCPMWALRALAHGLMTESQGALTFDTTYCFASEDKSTHGDAAVAFLNRNLKPNVVFEDMVARMEAHTNGVRDHAVFGDGKRRRRQKATDTAAPSAPTAQLPARDVLDIYIAGFTCTDNSTSNRNRKPMCEGGKSETTFSASIKSINALRPRAFILENTLGCPDEQVLQRLRHEVQPVYQIRVFKLNPIDNGHPVSRNRLWFVGIMANQCRAHLGIDTWDDVLQHILSTDLGLDMDNYLLSTSAPPVVAEFQALRQTALRECTKGNRDEPAASTWLTQHTASRDAYRKAGFAAPSVDRSGGTDAVAQRTISESWAPLYGHRQHDLVTLLEWHCLTINFVNPDTTCLTWDITAPSNHHRPLNSFGKGKAPCILKGHRRWNTLVKRHLLGLEDLLASGIPATVDLQSTTDKQCSQLVGNGMNVGTVGTLMGLIIQSLHWPPLPRDVIPPALNLSNLPVFCASNRRHLIVSKSDSGTVYPCCLFGLEEQKAKKDGSSKPATKARAKGESASRKRAAPPQALADADDEAKAPNDAAEAPSVVATSAACTTSCRDDFGVYSQPTECNSAPLSVAGGTSALAALAELDDELIQVLGGTCAAATSSATRASAPEVQPSIPLASMAASEMMAALLADEIDALLS